MASDIGWELYRSFLSVLREGSLSGAARALGVAQPTIGRHIAALEQSLKLALFTRSQTGFTPTEAALALQPYAEAMATTAEALKRTADSQGEGVKGSVRVTASEAMGIEVLPNIVAPLQAKYPELKVELVLTNRIQNLLKREADIAVRTTRPVQEQLLARQIGRVEMGLYAHKRYLAQNGVPSQPGDLAHHRLVGYDEETPYLRSARKGFAMWSRESFALRCDSDVAQFALIRAAAGIGICQVPLAQRDKQLVRVLPIVSIPLDLWLTMHEDLRHSPRCRVTFDALAEGLQRYVASGGSA